MEDERYPKLFGLLFLILALYFSVAFISYLFTWKADQDAVMHASMSILMDSSIEVENALGRLGAIISHLFFYSFVGLPAFTFVYLFATIGIQLLKYTPPHLASSVAGAKDDEIETSPRWIIIANSSKMIAKGCFSVKELRQMKTKYWMTKYQAKRLWHEN